MTPTDAAQEIVDSQNTHVRHNLSGLYGPDIARALLDAQSRIADLEGALRQICEFTEDYEHNQQLSEVWYIADSALTPEGGGK